MSTPNFFKDILEPFCEAADDYELREYSGRNYANNCVGVMIPSRGLIQFVMKLTKETMEADNVDFVEELEDFLRNIEQDSMGRHDIILYNSGWKWAEYNPEWLEDIEEESEEEIS
jgi:hypothetical protein